MGLDGKHFFLPFFIPLYLNYVFLVFKKKLVLRTMVALSIVVPVFSSTVEYLPIFPFSFI